MPQMYHLHCVIVKWDVFCSVCVCVCVCVEVGQVLTSTEKCDVANWEIH